MVKYEYQYIELVDYRENEDFKGETLDLLEDGFEFVFSLPETNDHVGVAYFKREIKENKK